MTQHDTDRTLKAQCPCGHTIVVDEPADGQSLYGTLAYRMARHEPCPAISRQNHWQFDHPHDVPDISEVTP